MVSIFKQKLRMLKFYLGKEELGCQGLFGSVATNITCNMLFQGNAMIYLSHKLKFFNPLIFQTVNLVRSNEISKVDPLGCKDTRN